MVQGGEIVVSNQGASNGIIHVIDRVLKPSVGNIGDILKSNPNFSIFSQMIENSAMNFTNMTLFAPTDQAFEVMDRERLENLLSNEECVEVRYTGLVERMILILPFFVNKTLFYTVNEIKDRIRFDFLRSLDSCQLFPPIS